MTNSIKTNKGSWLAVALLCAVSSACTTATAQVPRDPTATVAPGIPAVERYQTQLFNLLSNEKSILDRKNHFQAEFAAQFDTLLASSKLAKVDKTGVSLKKRLLSGPAPEGVLVKDPVSGSQWIYYEACQAHMCDETSLRLLFDPLSKKMSGKLNLNKQVEYIGDPSDAEKRLLDHKQPE